MKSIRSFPITISLFIFILVIFCVFTLFSLLNCNLIIREIFGSKETMWVAVGGILTGIAIATPIFWQIENRNLKRNERKKNLAVGLINEVLLNLRTVYLGGFEISLGTRIYEQVKSDLSVLKENETIDEFFEEFADLYTYSQYYQNIILSYTGNTQMLLKSEKLTWLQIQYLKILLKKNNSELEALEKIFNRVDDDINEKILVDDGFQKFKAGLYEQSSKDNADKIFRLYSSVIGAEQDKKGESLKEHSIEKFKDIWYSDIRVQLEKIRTSNLNKISKDLEKKTKKDLFGI